MADSELIVTVGANVAGFRQAIGQMSGDLQGFSSDTAQAGSALDDLFAHSDAVNGSLGNLSVNLEDVKQSAHDAAGGTGEAETGLRDFAEQLVAVGEAFAITETFREFGVEALTVYGNVEKASAALTALTGDAGEAEKEIEDLKDLAVSDALSFPALLQANQRLTAFKISSEAIPSLLHATADAAATMNSDFDSTASIIERIVESGAVLPRSLAQLALNVGDLATAMHTTSDQAAEMFKDLDVTGRANVLIQALAQYQGQAELAAQGISGEWTKLKDTVEFAMEDVGKSLAPITKDLVEKAIPDVKALAGTLSALPDSVKELGAGAGILSAALVGIVGGLGAIGFGISGIRSAIGPLLATIGEAGAGLAAGFGVLSLGAGAGIIATASQLGDLQKQYDDFASDVSRKNIFKLLSDGASVQDLQAAGFSIDQVRAAISGTSLEAYNGKKALDDLDLGIKVVTDDHKAAALTTEELKQKRLLLAGADREVKADETELAEMYKSLFIPTISEVSVAEEAVATARANVEQGIADLKAAEGKLDAARAVDNVKAIPALEQAAEEARKKGKQAVDDLKAKEQDLKASREASKATIADLAAADKDYANLLAQLVGPTVLSLQDAEDKLDRQRQIATQDLADLKQAEISRVAALASGNPVAIKQAEDDLDAARKRVKNDTEDLKNTEGQIKNARADLKVQTDLNIQGERDFDAALKALGGTTVPDLQTALQNIIDAKGRLLTATNTATAAEQAMNTAIAQYGLNSPQAVKAIDDFKEAKDREASATHNVNTEEGNAQTQYGLSKEAIRLLSNQTDTYLLSQGAMDDALKVSGQKTIPDLKAALDTANAALLVITTNGGSYQQSIVAQTNALQAQIDLWVAQGVAVPAAQQVMLATLKQNEQDYITSSVTRWGDMWTSIDHDVSGAFSAMDADITSGNFGKVLDDWKKGLEKMADAVLTAFVGPAEKAIASFIATSLTDLLTGTGSISDAWSTLGKNLSGIFGIGGSGGGSAIDALNKIPLNTHDWDATLGNLDKLGQAGTDLSASAGVVSDGGTKLAGAAGEISGAVGSGAGGLGGATGGGGGAGGGATSLLGTITSIGTMIGSLAGAVAGFMSVAEESNMKQSLNYIHNDTAMMEWALAQTGGIHDSNLDISNYAHQLLDSFNSYYIWVVNSFSDYWIGATVHLGAIRNDLLMPMKSTIEGIADTLTAGMAGIETAAEKIAALAQSSLNVQISQLQATVAVESMPLTLPPLNISIAPAPVNIDAQKVADILFAIISPTP